VEVFGEEVNPLDSIETNVLKKRIENKSSFCEHYISLNFLGNSKRDEKHSKNKCLMIAVAASFIALFLINETSFGYRLINRWQK